MITASTATGSTSTKHLRKAKKHKEKKKVLQKKDAKLGRKSTNGSGVDGKKKAGSAPNKCTGLKGLKPGKLVNVGSHKNSECGQDPAALSNALGDVPANSTIANVQSFSIVPRAQANVPGTGTGTVRVVRGNSSQKAPSADSVAEALFNTLFGAHRRPLRKALDWDETDGEGDDECVDEAWITSFLKDSVISSKAIDYALQDATQPQILEKYVDEGWVFSLVDKLRYEDPRLSSARLTLIRAIFRSCPRMRVCVCKALTQASDERVTRCAWVDSVAEQLEIDSDQVAMCETNPRRDCRAVACTPANGPAQSLVRDHATTMLELVQYLLDELASPSSTFFTRSSRALFVPPILPLHPTPPATYPVSDVRPQDSPAPARQRARSDSLVDEDLEATQRRTRSVGGIDCLKAQKRSTPPPSLCPSPCAGPLLSLNAVHGQGQAFAAFDEVMAAWRTCVWELYRTLVNVIRAHGTRLGCHNGPDPTELAETETCLRRLLVLAPYLGPYVCRSLIRTWPSGVASRVIAYVRACEITLSAVPCILPRETLAAQARLMHLNPSNLPLQAAHRCMCKVLQCVTSEHFRVAQQALLCIKNGVIVAQVLIPQRSLLKLTSEALRKNRTHWHPLVREQSEEAFDALLDFL